MANSNETKTIAWDSASITAMLEKAIEQPSGSLGTVTYRKLVFRMLVALYALQTADEQATGSTNHLNGCGFNGFDAPLLSDIAVRSQQYGSLTEKQTSLVARKLRKYTSQLARIAAAKTASASVGQEVNQ